jgi:hypothetical protein
MGVGDNEGQSEPDGYGEPSEGDGLSIGGEAEAPRLADASGEGDMPGVIDTDEVALGGMLGTADGWLVLVQPRTTLSSTKRTPQRSS